MRILKRNLFYTPPRCERFLLEDRRWPGGPRLLHNSSACRRRRPGGKGRHTLLTAALRITAAPAAIVGQGAHQRALCLRERRNPKQTRALGLPGGAPLGRGARRLGRRRGGRGRRGGCRERDACDYVRERRANPLIRTPHPSPKTPVVNIVANAKYFLHLVPWNPFPACPCKRSSLP